MLNVIMLNVIMLNVIMLNFIMQNVVMLSVVTPFYQFKPILSILEPFLIQS
jgi:hypothetical protein